MISKEEIEIIRKHYHARDHNNDYDKGNLGFGLVHYSFIRNLKALNILVVGSQRGYVPAICALACKHEGRGMVDFVDAGYDLNIKKEKKKSWGGVGLWKTVTGDYWKPLGVEGHIVIFTMTTKHFADCLKRDGGQYSYDYIYIDGDHSYKGVKRDYKLFWKYLTHGGFMVFHDVLVEKETPWGKCGVKRFWDEVKQRNPNCVTINQSAGLGMIQKKYEKNRRKNYRHLCF